VFVTLAELAPGQVITKNLVLGNQDIQNQVNGYERAFRQIKVSFYLEPQPQQASSSQLNAV